MRRPLPTLLSRPLAPMSNVAQPPLYIDAGREEKHAVGCTGDFPLRTCLARREHAWPRRRPGDYPLRGSSRTFRRRPGPRACRTASQRRHCASCSPPVYHLARPPNLTSRSTKSATARTMSATNHLKERLEQSRNVPTTEPSMLTVNVDAELLPIEELEDGIRGY